MGWRFRRSLKIAPGLRLNIGKRGISSLSVGGRGARLTFGKHGVRQTVGLPGTGLSFSSTTRLGSSLRNTEAPTSVPKPPFVDPKRFGIVAEPLPPDAGKTKKTFFILGVITIGAAVVFPVPNDLRPWALLGGGVLFALGFARPSRASLEAVEQRRIEDVARDELARRVSTFAAAVAGLSTSQALSADLKRVLAKRHELGLTAEEAAPCQRHIDDLARAELAQRVSTFGAAVAGLSSSPSSLGVKRVLATQHELGLTDSEAGPLQIEKLKAIDAVLDFEASCGDHLPAVPAPQHIVAPDICYFAAEAVHDRRGENDPAGTLYLTDKRVLFVSTEGLTSAAWRQVLSVGLDGRTLRIQRRDRQNPYLFDFSTYTDAMKAEFITKRVFKSFSSLLQGDLGTFERPQHPVQEKDSPSPPARIDKRELNDQHDCDLGSGVDWSVAVVGDEYSQTALLDLSAGRRLRGEEVQFIASLVPELTHPYDANATQVHILNGAHVGYLSKADAAAYAVALKALSATGKQGVCRARLIGGTPDKTTIGVLLDLLDPDTLIAKLSPGGQPF
jgi:Protein of unknown function (DUF4236)